MKSNGNCFGSPRSALVMSVDLTNAHVDTGSRPWVVPIVVNPKSGAGVAASTPCEMDPYRVPPFFRSSQLERNTIQWASLGVVHSRTRIARRFFRAAPGACAVFSLEKSGLAIRALLPSRTFKVKLIATAGQERARAIRRRSGRNDSGALGKSSLSIWGRTVPLPEALRNHA